MVIIMEERVALISIIVRDKKDIGKLNEILGLYGEYVIGRMGLPHTKSSISLISVGIEAPQDVINTLSGKLGQLSGITSKVIYA